MLDIKSDDRVLEIGSGSRPRKRSDILCDKYIESNDERACGDNIVIDERPFVVADALALPFKDKSFDYVIASHILEHVIDPYQFVNELMRVAKRGYIETPSELGEKIFGWQFHKWIVRLKDDTIMMRRRMEESPFGEYFHKMYHNNVLFAEVVDSQFPHYYIQYQWKDTIKLLIENDADKNVKYSVTNKVIQTQSRSRILIIKLMTYLLSGILRIIRHFRKYE